MPFLPHLALKLIALPLALLHGLLFPVVGLLANGGLTTAPLDRVRDSHYAKASDALCDPQAMPEAKALMAYLKAQYGSRTLSGQYVSPYERYDLPRFRHENGLPDIRLSNELRAVKDLTGKYPAMVGLDFTGVEFQYNGQWVDWVTQFAVQWHALGGVVTMCWHWSVPADVTKPWEAWSRWESAIYPKDTNFSLKAALADKAGDSYQWLLHGIEAVAAQLQVLQEAGVPVLWRPLHEAAGGWFWWGSEGREPYLELYNLLFDKLVNEYNLHNLVWVWNGQDPKWYPGDDKADILGDDPYPPLKWLHAADPAKSVRFKYTRRASGTKMVAMTENDTLPNLNLMWGQNVKWLTFCTWDRERLLKPDPDDQPYGHLPEFSGEYDCAQRVRAIYNDPRVITLDTVRWR